MALDVLRQAPEGTSWGGMCTTLPQKLPSFIALVTPDFRMWAFLKTFTLHPDLSALKTLMNSISITDYLKVLSPGG